MLFSKVITGTYGSEKTGCFIYCCNDSYATWYAVEGSLNVNCTYEALEDGCNVEEVSDFDTMTAGTPINSIEELERLVNEEDEEPKEEEANPIEIWETYEFNDIDEFYNYIIDSKINGQPQQVRKLLEECTPDQVKGFLQSYMVVCNDNAIYCKNIALDVLTEKASA